MAKQLQANPSTKRISELYKRIKAPNPTLILQPEFQRKLVWSGEHKEKFIETIIKGLPIPEIYIAQSGIDVEKIETQEVVVDGQQRLSTIVQYIDDPDDDSNVFGKIVPKYRDLENKDDFLNYLIVIRDLGDIDSETIIEIFKRINSTQYGLNSIELHNAIYDGMYITTAKDILSNIEEKDMPFLTNSEITRMEDLHFILSLLTTIEHGGYFSRDKEIERYIILFNDVYPNSEMIKQKFNSVFQLISELNLPIDSIWYRKSNFFTLFIELYNHIDNLTDLDNVRDKLIRFEENVLANKRVGTKENDFSVYYSYMYTGTNSRNARVIRAEIFNRYIVN